VRKLPMKITVHIEDESLTRRVRVEAARHDMFIRNIVMEAVEAYLHKLEVTAIKPGRSRTSIAQEA
jgi:hypothetical protein